MKKQKKNMENKRKMALKLCIMSIKCPIEPMAYQIYYFLNLFS